MSAAAGTYPLLSPGELEALPDPEWLVDGLIPRKGLTTLFARGGTGKSLLALDWANCVAAGLPWLGHETQPGRVVYIAAEGLAGLGARQRAWRSAHAAPAADGLWIVPTAINLLHEEAQDKTRRTLEQVAPISLLIVDTAARSMPGGDENSSQDMGRLVSAVDALRGDGAAVVLHHARKEDGEMRGSTVLHDSSDVVLELKRSTADRSKLTLRSEKVRDASPISDIELGVKQQGASCVLVPDPASNTGVDTGTEAANVHESRVLAHLAAADEPMSKSGICAAVKGRRAALFAAVDQLAAKGAIVEGPRGWTAVPDSGNRLGTTTSSRSGSHPPENPVPMRREPLGTGVSRTRAAGGSPGGRPFRGAPAGTAGSPERTPLATQIAGHCACSRPFPERGGAVERCLACELPIAVVAVA